MANNNGQLVLQALENIEEPATATQIVSHVAEISGVRPREVKESVQDTLKGGVRYGYIQHRNRKYFSMPVELDGIQHAEVPEEEHADSDEENADSDEENTERTDHEERSRRRRRRGGRRRRRSRRRSRR